jgi:hypothetical protein
MSTNETATRNHAAEHARRNPRKLIEYRRESYWRRNQRAIEAGHTSYSAMRRKEARRER